MIRAYAVGVVFTGLVLFPVFLDSSRDSYPLSNYPMFSHRIDPVNDVSAVIGRGSDGNRQLLSPQLIGNSDEVMIVLRTVNNAIRAGGGATATLCNAVAGRVWAEGHTSIVRIEVVTERYDTIAWFSGDKEPIATTVHATCEVGS